MPDTSQYSRKKKKNTQHTERKRKKGEKKREMLFTFTCFAFLSAWVRMTFHFLPRVISKGLIQFALQAVSNPHSLLNFSLHRLNTRTFAVWLSFNGKTWRVSTRRSEKKTVCQSYPAVPLNHHDIYLPLVKRDSSFTSFLLLFRRAVYGGSDCEDQHIDKWRNTRFNMEFSPVRLNGCCMASTDWAGCHIFYIILVFDVSPNSH